MAEQHNYGTGRRKTSAARVFLSAGGGSITVNGRPLDEFYLYEMEEKQEWDAL